MAQMRKKKKHIFVFIFFFPIFHEKREIFFFHPSSAYAAADVDGGRSEERKSEGAHIMLFQYDIIYIENKIKEIKKNILGTR
jgi:hypothetical protein